MGGENGWPAVATFGTKQEAVATALRSRKKAKSARIVVHGKDDGILEHHSHGMPKIQEPPRKGRLATRKIAAVVGKVVLKRLRAGSESVPED